MLAAAVNRNHGDAGPGRHDSDAPLGLHLSLVVHPGPLGENDQPSPLVEALHGGLHGGQVTAAPFHREGSQLGDDPAQQRNTKELLLGHEGQTGVVGQAHGDNNGVPGAGMVAAQQSAALRYILQPHRPVGEQQADDGLNEDVNVMKKAVHRFTRSLMIAKIWSRLCSKVLPVVSRRTASSAGRRGAAERWESL